MQSLGMIKVQFSVEVRMAKRNEDGEMTHFDNYMKNEDRVIQNENEIREKVIEFMDEVNNRIGHFRVPKNLTFKARLSGKPLI